MLALRISHKIAKLRDRYLQLYFLENDSLFQNKTKQNGYVTFEITNFDAGAIFCPVNPRQSPRGPDKGHFLSPLSVVLFPPGQAVRSLSFSILIQFNYNKL
jgi:hypothetical protein